jgi:hypothetical protein
VPVLAMSTSTMGLSGAICGLVLGLRRRPRRTRGLAPVVDAADQPDGADQPDDERAEMTASIVRRRVPASNADPAADDASPVDPDEPT